MLAELTLAMVLFTDASNANFGVLKSSIRLPKRLLLIGLPLTILLGFGAGVLIFPGLGLFEVAILAIMLAPTDAALGKAVVTDERVPDNIREGLNVESGLNDGICVPILFVFLALATDKAGGDGPATLALHFLAEEIGIGVAVGIGLTLAGSWLLKLFGGRGWITESWRQLPVFLVLAGTGVSNGEKLFMGWFGPRGLASIVFIVIVLGENLPGAHTLASTVVCTIVFSIIGHGLSANPLVAALGARLKSSASAG